MKYESLNVEIIFIENEDILTLSLGDNTGVGEGKKLGWDELWI